MVSIAILPTRNPDNASPVYVSRWSTSTQNGQILYRPRIQLEWTPIEGKRLIVADYS
jgi:hypothetical protein